MLEAQLRHAATVLLETAIRMAPPDAREWGRAMRGELMHVEGAWAALRWALGGATVLAKGTLASLLLPGRRGQGVAADGGLFAKDVSLSKAALTVGGACALGALLFFAAPPFRQGIRVSLEAWRVMLGMSREHSRLLSLARRAEARHDPAGLAFAAARLWDGGESARLADEAVRLDPTLIWVYAVVAVRHPELRAGAQWAPKLIRWDPQNALPYLIVAESIDIAHIVQPPPLPPPEAQKGVEQDADWESAMAAAFAARKFDDYLDRLQELGRTVVLRYGFNDPFELVMVEREGLPFYAFWDSERFAKSMVQSGRELESRGDRKGAEAKYWAVARFGQMIDSEAQTFEEHWMGTRLQALAYEPLRALAEKEDRAGEAALFSYLAGEADLDKLQRAAALEGGAWGLEVSRRNAAVLQVSSLTMLVFAGLGLVAGSFLLAGVGRGKRPAVLGGRPVAAMTAFISAVGFLLSAAAVYLTYRPYWYLFQHVVLSRDRGQTRDLSSFLSATHVVPGFAPSDHLALRVPVYFWTGVTLVGVSALVVTLVRCLLARRRASSST